MAKGTPIHVDLLDSPDVKRFAETAESVCDVFERIDELSKIEFLQQLEELLPLVYYLAYHIPDPYDWPDDDEDEEWEPTDREPWPTAMSERESIDLSLEIHDRIIGKLGWHSLAHLVYDPVGAAERNTYPSRPRPHTRRCVHRSEERVNTLLQIVGRRSSAGHLALAVRDRSGLGARGVSGDAAHPLTRSQSL